METTKHDSIMEQTQTDGVHVNWPTIDAWRVTGVWSAMVNYDDCGWNSVNLPFILVTY
jgi:hypothetical protein